MRMLETLLKMQLESSNDMTRLPADVLKAIRTNIRKGAEDLNQDWANALELVHRAYEIEGAQRPSPDMDAAWEQYETLLQYSVEQLAKNRGMDGDWRMSAAMFHEAQQSKPKFKVHINEESFVTEGDNVEQVITRLTERVGKEGLETQIHERNDSVELSFNRFGIKRPTKVLIREL